MIGHTQGNEYRIEPVLAKGVGEQLGPGMAGDADEADEAIGARLLQRGDGAIRGKCLLQVGPR